MPRRSVASRKYLLGNVNKNFMEGDRTMDKAFSWLALIVLAELAVAPASQAQNPAEGQKLYSTYCSTCHGEIGKGDGVAGASLAGKTAYHTNGAGVNQVNDRVLIDIISKCWSGVRKMPF